jgi:hypothetical protein
MVQWNMFYFLLKTCFLVVLEPDLVELEPLEPEPPVPTEPRPYHNFYPEKAPYENDAAPPIVNTVTYFRSFFLVITSIMVTNFRNYEPS